MRYTEGFRQSSRKIIDIAVGHMIFVVLWYPKYSSLCAVNNRCIEVSALGVSANLIPSLPNELESGDVSQIPKAVRLPFLNVRAHRPYGVEGI